MKQTSIKLKEVLVRNINPHKDLIEFNSVISINNTNHDLLVKIGIGLPQEMNLAFLKKIRESQEKPVTTFYSTPSDFIQIISIEEHDIVEKKLLFFFRTIWQEIHHMKSHRSLSPPAEKLEEIRNMRIRL